MKKVLVLLIVLLVVISSTAFSKKADNFDQAKAMSVELKLPILLEFVHED
ncbi:MAG: hypothetical protein GY865_07965 [candidate division Zixibacteria bacterium]|nr:hypothetical protein [candidate division Zixibacteria bacterium]